MYSVDFTKVSPMIQENVSQDVVVAAKKVSWEFFVEESEFESKQKVFYDVVETYLSKINSTDSDSMCAMLLYYTVIDDLKH